MTNPSTSTSKGIWAWDLVKVIFVLSLLGFAAILAYYGFDEESNRMIIRGTAKISFTLFALAFAASGIHLFFRKPITFWVLMNRKYLGISFALMHGIHLFALFSLQYFFHPVFEKADLISLLAGGLAYFFLMLMFFTSFPTFSKHLSQKQWKILHTLGGYWILFIFTTSYTKRFMTEWKWLPFVVAIGLVLFFRFWGWREKRGRKTRSMEG